jgi:class 3 adenylate cyclase
LSTDATDEPPVLVGPDRELEAIKRFPEGNPNPVLQIAGDGSLRYANPASRPVLAALHLEVGDELPPELAREIRDALRLVPPRAFELPAGGQTFAVLPVEAPELGVVNLYATDVTAARVLERFPDWNPNPVLRVSRDGTLLYANAVSAPIVRELGARIGEQLTPGATSHLLRAVDEPEPEPLEIHCDGRHYALHPRFVPELGTINVYGSDVTALRAMDKFPDENPNPVLRVTRDGRLRYANPASDALLAALDVEVGGRLPDEFFGQVRAAADRGVGERLELRADGRTFELLTVSVYEFDFINLYGTDVTAARAIEQANRENERLLLAILPPSVAERLRSGETSIADSFDEMTVLFADLVGFTELSSRLSAAEVVAILNRVFSRYDELADHYGLEKIKTIGDAYMAVGGITSDSHRPDDVEAVAEMALEMVSATERLAAEAGYDLQVRIGVHVGPTVAGVIGMRKFIYDVWGDAVNRASRMESYGVPGRIQVTEETYLRLSGRFRLDRRGSITIKGLGPVTTYFLLGKKTG